MLLLTLIVEHRTQVLLVIQQVLQVSSLILQHLILEMLEGHFIEAVVEVVFHFGIWFVPRLCQILAVKVEVVNVGYLQFVYEMLIVWFSGSLGERRIGCGWSLCLVAGGLVRSLLGCLRLLQCALLSALTLDPGQQLARLYDHVDVGLRLLLYLFDLLRRLLLFDGLSVAFSIGHGEVTIGAFRSCGTAVGVHLRHRSIGVVFHSFSAVRFIGRHWLVTLVILLVLVTIVVVADLHVDLLHF